MPLYIKYLHIKEELKKKKKVEIVLSIYVAIGTKQSAVARIANILEKRNCLDFTVIVSATAASPMGLQYIAPYAGATIAEFWMDLGLDTLVIYDDLSKHAAVYRQCLYF